MYLQCCHFPVCIVAIATAAATSPKLYYAVVVVVVVVVAAGAAIMPCRGIDLICFDQFLLNSSFNCLQK